MWLRGFLARPALCSGQQDSSRIFLVQQHLDKRSLELWLGLRYGYKSGYYDKATGKACTLPAVPPPCYWSTSISAAMGRSTLLTGIADTNVVSRRLKAVATHTSTMYRWDHRLLSSIKMAVVPATLHRLFVRRRDRTGLSTEGHVPQIPHLSSSETGVASSVPSQPVYQASAVGEQTVAAPYVFQPNLSSHLGLIGRTGQPSCQRKPTLHVSRRPHVYRYRWYRRRFPR